MATTFQEATLAGGCFWCLESAFKQLEGVIDAQSGYAGGQLENPSYEQVCSGTTGHAEVVRLQFNPEHISFREILEIFFALHDPTQLNRQGNDIGTQYRSAVFYHNAEQREQTEAIIAEIEREQIWPGADGKGKVVTQIEPLDTYYAAEEYHRDYFLRNPENQYCQAVVSPKLAKFRKTFAARLKQDA